MAEEKKGIQILELKAIIGMMKATAEVATELRMTGGDDRPPRAGIRQYNAVLERIKNYLPDFLIPLEEDATLIDLAMSCQQLIGLLDGMMEGAGMGESDKRQTGTPIINIGDGADMKNMGDLIRRAMPAWIREQMDKEYQKEQEGAISPESDIVDLKSRMVELGDQMQALAQRMQEEELSSDEIHDLADQMRELGQQQSDITRQRANKQ